MDSLWWLETPTLEDEGLPQHRHAHSSQLLERRIFRQKLEAAMCLDIVPIDNASTTGFVKSAAGL